MQLLRRVTKDLIAYFVLGMMIALGLAVVIFHMASYIDNQADYLTPFVIYSWGFGLIIGGIIGILIKLSRKKKW